MKNFFKARGLGIFAFMFILSVYFMPLKIFAQTQTSISISPSGPIHPLVNYGENRIRTNLDTVIYYDYYSIYFIEVLEEPIKTIVCFTRSEDELTDTLHTYFGSNVWKYSKQNKLLYDYQYSPLHPLLEYVRTNYEYDEDGRVVKEVQTSIKPSENYSEKFLGERVYDYSSIQFTEKGYIFENIEYEFDDQERLTCMIYLSLGNELIKYSDGREFRKNAFYYTYTDSSFTEFGNWTMSYAILDRPDLWIENIYVFNENGSVEWFKKNESEDGINWHNRAKTKVEYVYSNDPRSDDIGTTDNVSIFKSKTVVYGLSREIYISNEKATTVQVFDITGRLVKQQELTAGENRIRVNNGGFYIVKSGNETFKVYVK